jgi:decaprenyl-phosphate phosphoribosyltransferase
MVKQILQIENLKQILILLRIDQWQKNFLVFCPLFFSLKNTQTHLVSLFFVFFIFILGSSLVYILNDYVDRKKDRLNPFKKDRPLASKKITPNSAFTLFFIIAVFIVFIAYNYISSKVILLLLFYFVINIFYSFYLKKIFIFDIFTVALGYVIRVLAGYYQLNEDYELFLLTGIFLLSLIILLLKRKSEFNPSVYKKSLRFYNYKIINKIFYFLYIIILINYFLFIKIFLNTHDLILSFLPIILALLRLNFLLINKKIKKNISVVLISDYSISINFILWTIIIFFKPIQNFL